MPAIEGGRLYVRGVWPFSRATVTVQLRTLAPSAWFPAVLQGSPDLGASIPDLYPPLVAILFGGLAIGVWA